MTTTETPILVLALQKIHNCGSTSKSYTCYAAFSPTNDAYDNIIWFERIYSFGIDTVLMHNVTKGKMTMYSAEDIVYNVVLDQ